MSMKRFLVSGHSMMPFLRPGDEVVATSSRSPVPGDVVAFPRPGQPETWLIKRLADHSGRVSSDNTADSALDSRDLGLLDVGSMMAVVERLDESSFVEGCELLANEEPAFARAIEDFGVPPFWHRPAGFRTLVLLVLEQQVSLESGAAMYRRLSALVGDVNPENLLGRGDAGLRSIGVTRQKSRYLLALAHEVVSGALDLGVLDDLTVGDARDRLMELKGIGAWTADAYLLSAQRRPDMWPVGDRALQVGVGELLGLGTIPNQPELEIIGEPWRPIRAVAARIIWHAYLARRRRVEPPDPTSPRTES
jgi:DNA-3-methyladenine glycosylase II